MAFLTAGGVELPCPVTLKVNHEIIWSANTGRTSSGLMVGDVVAQKRNLEIEWGILTDVEIGKIKKYLLPGFFPLAFHDFGGTTTMTGYRGTLSGEMLGTLPDGITYWRSATVTIIQQ